MKFLNKIVSILLTPFSFLWEEIYRIRRFFYKIGFIKRNSFAVPIISVGNLTFGGTGKTPFSIWISRTVGEWDKRAMILMRGYKGKLENKFGIIRGGRGMGVAPGDFGDEAILYARKLPHASVVVGKRRSENLAHYYPSEKSDVVILDDGHQHLKLNRDLNIVLFDSLLPIQKYRVAPKGYMREGLSALKDADVVVYGRCDQATPQKIKELKSLVNPYLKKGTIQAEIGYRPTGIFNSYFEKEFEPEELKDKKVICLSGIASPTSFYNIVESFGGNIIKKYSFPDHHFFKNSEIENILAEGRKNDALILTTEKDIVKMRRMTSGDKIYFLEIMVNFFSGEKEVKDKIKEVLK